MLAETFNFLHVWLHPQWFAKYGKVGLKYGVSGVSVIFATLDQPYRNSKTWSSATKQLSIRIYLITKYLRHCKVDFPWVLGQRLEWTKVRIACKFVGFVHWTMWVIVLVRTLKRMLTLIFCLFLNCSPLWISIGSSLCPC